MKFLQDAKRQVTLCVVCPMLAGPILGQIVFTGKTKKVVPDIVFPPNVTCTASEVTGAQLGRGWRCSRALGTRLVVGLGHPLWVKLVFVPPTHTGTAQPLDVAYNGVLKASLSRVATTHFAKLLLDALEADQKDARHVDTRLSSLKQLLPHWVGASLDELSARDAVRSLGWHHLWVEDGEAREAIIAEAQKLHKEGNLFWHVGKKGVPRMPPAMARTRTRARLRKTRTRRKRAFPC